jgi:hypothetical protein
VPHFRPALISGVWLSEVITAATLTPTHDAEGNARRHWRVRTGEALAGKPANLPCAQRGAATLGFVMVSERKDGMRVLIIGPPGAGKGTKAARISDRYDVPALSIGDAFRARIAAGTQLGADAERYLLACEHVPDEVADRIQSALGHAHP